MSTIDEKLLAQEEAFASKKSWTRHLVGPMALRSLLDMEARSRPISTGYRIPTAKELPCLSWSNHGHQWMVNAFGVSPKESKWWMPLPEAPEE